MLTLLRAIGAMSFGVAAIFAVVAWPLMLGCSYAGWVRDWSIHKHNRIAAGRRALAAQEKETGR